MPKPIIAPSLLAGDLSQIAVEARRAVEDYGADWLHVDCMDGHFVPNWTIGAPVVQAMRRHTTATLDCHLMATNPEKWVADFAKAGASNFTFHLEAVSDSKLQQLCADIRAAKMRVGIAVKPGTSVDHPELVRLVQASMVDMILVMTVEPGFGGQPFMPECLPKVRWLRDRFPELDIQVDGGVTLKNIQDIVKAGANVIVAGTSILGAAHPKQSIDEFRAAFNQ